MCEFVELQCKHGRWDKISGKGCYMPIEFMHICDDAHYTFQLSTENIPATVQKDFRQ